MSGDSLKLSVIGPVSNHRLRIARGVAFAVGNDRVGLRSAYTITAPLAGIADASDAATRRQPVTAASANARVLTSLRMFGSQSCEWLQSLRAIGSAEEKLCLPKEGRSARNQARVDAGGRLRKDGGTAPTLINRKDDRRENSAAASPDVQLVDLVLQQRHGIIRVLKVGDEIIRGAAHVTSDVRIFHERLVKVDDHRAE
jgi:hypothetical protein